MKFNFLFSAWFALLCGGFPGICEAVCPLPRTTGERESSAEALGLSRSTENIGQHFLVVNNERISGGQNTVPNEFPWQAYIQVYFWSGTSAVCGGSLISDEWVVFAAHCAYGAADIVVTLGAHDTSAPSQDDHRQVFSVSLRSVTLHPDWFYPKFEDDIALIHLPSKAIVNAYVSPINLPYTNEESSFEDELVILTGWGNFSSVPESGFSPQLQKTVTTVLGSTGLDPDCQRESELIFNGAKIICGDGKESHRFCYGDDGGPMNYYRSDEGKWILIGVATVGDASANCALSTKPNLYTRVSYYLDWIHNSTQIPPTVFTTTTSTTTTPSTTSSTTSVTSTTSTTTSTTTTRRPLGYCRDLPDGFYPIPDEDCTRYFIECRDYTTYFLECPEQDTVFYADFCRCDYPYNVPGCPTFTAFPSP